MYLDFHLFHLYAFVYTQSTFLKNGWNTLRSCQCQQELPGWLYTLSHWIYSRKQKIPICGFIISLHWQGTCNRNLFPWKTRIYSFYGDNNIVADVLVLEDQDHQQPSHWRSYLGILWFQQRRDKDLLCSCKGNYVSRYISLTNSIGCLYHIIPIV